MSVYIRLLRESDASTSYKWRNDPEVWKFTGNRPDKIITPAIEAEWLKKVLVKPDELRFAICIEETDEYIGNVQLTGINFYEAEFHIFIGEKKYWGKGFGTVATNLIVEYAFSELKLQCVYLLVKELNAGAVRSYEKAGFRRIIETDGYLRLAKYAFDKDEKTASVFVMAYNHEAFILQTIEGILNQKTNFSLEIVIGEDNSTDKTREIIFDYAKKYPGRFKLILHNRNIGAKLNQIAVLNACSGNYIAMCEGDDYWTDASKLQKQIDFLEANPDFAICFHKTEIIRQDESKESQLSNPNQQEVTSFEDLASHGNYIQTASCVFRNGLFPFSVFATAFSTAKMGDWILHLLNAEHGRIKYFDDVMSVYRVHDGGAWSNRDTIAHSKGMLEAVDLCRNYFAKEKKKYFDRFSAKLYAQMCFAYFENDDRLSYRRSFKELLEFKKYISLRTFTALVIRFFLSYVPVFTAGYKKLREK